MKKTIRISIIAAAVLMSASCALLDVENPSNIYGSGYWNSKGDVESYLTGTYTTFRSTCNTTSYLTERSDEFVSGLEAGTSIYLSQGLTSLNGTSWADFYKVIQHCNMIIKYAPTVSFSRESDLDDILAQAYTIRGYMFFYVARVWGAAPLELVPTESSEKPKLGRSPAIDVVNQAIDDAQKAISLFSRDGWVAGKGKASKQAAYAMMADMLLWRAKVLNGGDKDLEDAINYADLAMAGTALETDFSRIYGTRKGQEVIWAIHFGYPEITGQYSHLLKPRDIFVENAVNKDEIAYAKSGARSSFAPSPAIIALLKTYPGDVRQNSYIVAKDAGGNTLGTFDNKMRGTASESNVSYDNDIILYRTAEMILFKAEALAALNRVDEAIAQLDLVRNRAQIGNYSGSVNRRAVEAEICNERGREFYLENKRWPDLLRFHYEGVINVYDVVPNLKAKARQGLFIPLYLAIPTMDMDLNHELVQTEGYEDL